VGSVENRGVEALLASLVLVFGCAVSASPAGAASPTPVVQIGPGGITVLMADRARRSDQLEPFVVWGKPEGRAWVRNWKSPDDSFEWTVEVPEEAPYEAIVLASGAAGDEIEIVGPANRLVLKLARKGWDRLGVPGKLALPKGQSVIRVRLLRPADACLKSVELVNVAERPSIDARVKAFRADTSWLGEAKYGVMFQWGQWGCPRHGRPKPWPKMIDDFDSEAFARMVEETGAGYVIWSVTWRTFYFPAPIKAIDAILPGRTSERDLVGDLADALGKRGIKLTLYYHEGHPDREWWSRNWVSGDDKDKFHDNWCAIITEVGQRYKEKLAGWWFDDGMLYYPAPFERLGKAAKAGHPGRFVAYNAWVLPRLTVFQEVAFGEGYRGGSADVGDDGIFTDGPQQGLRSQGMFIVDGPDWGIYQPETKINPPAFSAEQAVEMVRKAAAKKEALSFNLLMYEDGSVGEQSLALMKAVRKAIRGEGPAVWATGRSSS